MRGVFVFLILFVSLYKFRNIVIYLFKVAVLLNGFYSIRNTLVIVFHKIIILFYIILYFFGWYFLFSIVNWELFFLIR